MRTFRSACRSLSSLAFVFAALGPLVDASGQCTPQWLPSHGLPGVDLACTTATIWTPTVGSLRNPQLVVAGAFEFAGTVPATSIAAFDLVTRTWSALGNGLQSYIWAVAGLPNGHLVAGGFNNPFTGLFPHGVYVWDGATWSPLGGGVDGTVCALVVQPNGDLIVAGEFLHAGTVPAANIARWDGANWHALGQGTQGLVKALALMPNGDLAVGESFPVYTTGAWVVRIHFWNGTSWSTIAQPNAAVRCLAARPNGDLVAGGSFTDIGHYVARWNGTSWTDLGGTIQSLQPTIEGLAALPNGDVVATGRFTGIGGVAANYVALWNGSAWSALDTGINGVGQSVARLPGGGFAVLGYFTTAGDVFARSVALWDGVEWRAPGAGLDGSVRALAVAPNGEYFAGGSFANGLGTTMRGIGRWDGAAWNPLGTGVAGGDVHALERLANGDLVAAGTFVTAGSMPAGAIARWDGTSWLPLGTGLGGAAVPSGFALAELPNGDVVVAGNFTTAGGVPASAIARWDGTAWADLAGGLQGGAFGAPVGNALAVMPNGDVVVGGRFQSAGGAVVNSIARWNGTTWSAMAGGLGNDATVRSLALLEDGELVAGGSFNTLGSAVARWNGAQWTAVGALAGNARSVVVLPNGDIVAGGPFPLGDSFMRWTNGAWQPFAAGQTAIAVYAMAMLPSGELAIAADFPIYGEYSAHLMSVATTCPAAAVTDGAGCIGSGGLNNLTAETLPWLGSTYRANTGGLATNALAVGVLGLGNPAMPLSSLLPQGLPGCTLHVTPDLLSFLVPSGGSVRWSIAIPNTAALVTQTFRQQVVALELTTSSAITAFTSANALSLTIGDF